MKCANIKTAASNACNFAQEYGSKALKFGKLNGKKVMPYLPDAVGFGTAFLSVYLLNIEMPSGCLSTKNATHVGSQSLEQCSKTTGMLFLKAFTVLVSYPIAGKSSQFALDKATAYFTKTPAVAPQSFDEVEESESEEEVEESESEKEVEETETNNTPATSPQSKEKVETSEDTVVKAAEETTETTAKTEETIAKTEETVAKTEETVAKTEETVAKTAETAAKTTETAELVI